MRTTLLLLIAACRTASPPPVPIVEDAPVAAQAAEPAAEAVPEAPAAAVERQTLTLDPDELTYDDAAKTVTFSPGSGVKSASYTHYVLDLASLESVLGGRPTAPVAVVVEVGPAVEENEKPADPSMSAPMGGFDITTYTGRVVEKAAAP
jgi:hypothetical protein